MQNKVTKSYVYSCCGLTGEPCHSIRWFHETAACTALALQWHLCELEDASIVLRQTCNIYAVIFSCPLSFWDTIGDFNDLFSFGSQCCQELHLPAGCGQMQHAAAHLHLEIAQFWTASNTLQIMQNMFLPWTIMQVQTSTGLVPVLCAQQMSLHYLHHGCRQ